MFETVVLAVSRTGTGALFYRAGRAWWLVALAAIIGILVASVATKSGKAGAILAPVVGLASFWLAWGILFRIFPRFAGKRYLLFRSGTGISSLNTLLKAVQRHPGVGLAALAAFLLALLAANKVSWLWRAYFGCATFFMTVMVMRVVQVKYG